MATVSNRPVRAAAPAAQQPKPATAAKRAAARPTAPEAAKSAIAPVAKPGKTGAKGAKAAPPPASGAAPGGPGKEGNAKAGKKQRDGKAPQDGAKAKVIRDSFTMPAWDYAKLAELKRRCLNGGAQVKKSELLRAGLKMLESLPERQLLAVVAQVETVKTGRPAKRKAREATAQ